MGMLKDIRDQMNRHRVSSWKILEGEDDLNLAHEQSFKQPVVLFKHSTSCGISARAKYLLEQEWADLVDKVDFYYLDLLRYRSVSNTIAKKYGVVHQSPQVIIVHQGNAVYDTSHHRISISDLSHQLTLLN